MSEHPSIYMNETDWKGGQDKFEPLPTYRDTEAKRFVREETDEALKEIQRKVKNELDAVRSKR